MGAIVNLTRNNEVLQGFQIESSLDMHTVLDWAAGKGYSGHINIDANGARTMGLTSPNGTAQPARIGDWAVIKNNTTITLVPQEHAASLYSIAP